MPQVRFDVEPGLRIGVFLAGLLLCLAGCSQQKKSVAEAPPAPLAGSAASAQSSQAIANNVPPPDTNSVADAVKRVFQDSAAIDTNQKTPFTVGDFNGDLAQDLAVVLKPAPDKLSAMNEEFPTWILRDPMGNAESKAPRLRIAADDVLLAVIHGYGPNAWRAPEATQTFLLKHVVGLGMTAHRVKEFAAANNGKKLPHLRGDLIGETLEGKPGYLYFNGAGYAWYDPKAFTGEPDPRRGHGGQKVKQ